MVGIGLLVQVDCLVGMTVGVDVGVEKGDGDGDGVWMETDAVGVMDGRSPSTVSVTTICGVGVGLHAATIPARMMIPNPIKVVLFDIIPQLTNSYFLLTFTSFADILSSILERNKYHA